LAFVREVVNDVVGYIVDNKCQAVMVDNITNHIMNHFSNKSLAVMVDNVTNHIMNHFSKKSQAVMAFVSEVVGYIVDHYCLAFIREVVHYVVGYIVDHYCLAFVREVVPHHEPLL
jgi:hypothetical protein